MKFFPFITLAGILTLIAYGISRTVSASRLSYLIQNAAESSSQLAILITVTNSQNQTFTQKNFLADISVNGNTVSSIADSSSVTLPANQVTPQGWILDLPVGGVPGGALQLIRIRGTVDIDNLTVPVDLKYKFI